MNIAQVQPTSTPSTRAPRRVVDLNLYAEVTVRSLFRRARVEAGVRISIRGLARAILASQAGTAEIARAEDAVRSLLVAARDAADERTAAIRLADWVDRRLCVFSGGGEHVNRRKREVVAAALLDVSSVES
jgi:hypothetical protein